MTTVEYVARHVMGHVTPPELEIMIVLARADRGTSGRIRGVTAADIALARQRSTSTVAKQLARLIRDGRHLCRDRWTYIIVGAAEHDPAHCWHGDCITQALGDQLARRRARKLRAAALAARTGTLEAGSVSAVPG